MLKYQNQTYRTNATIINCCPLAMNRLTQLSFDLCLSADNMPED